MSQTEKLQSALILVAIVIGLLLGQIDWAAEKASGLIVPALMLMLFGIFLNLPLVRLGQAFQNYQVLVLSLGVNFLWTPVFAWGLGAIFLRSSPDLWVGLIMLMVTPCTDWYLVFTGIAQGNTALAAALLPWNLLLQMILLPIYLLVFAGLLIQVDRALLLQSGVLVLGVPILLAFVTRRVMPHLGSGWRQIPLKLATAQPLFLWGAIAAMFASQGQILLQRPDLLLKMLLPMLIFFGVNFYLGQAIGRVCRLSYENLACFTCTTLARNSPIALAIATSAFPDRPLISLALVIGPLIELPVLVLVSQRLLTMRSYRSASGANR
ncbi:arsenic resistance protein [Pseudanabaena sp. FACHB-2040]|uniref:arsenic resistance protein n=1 Tax=Pseudanabaena sp. FACHB-2040 TaxID=2692859 RepID=UPI0016890BC5|nr:arsenic resistance protein [Pseudanabaena sp. FACHB-2040]MBD2261270.1 arsenic resistance protein [Pseudanabaena sp. FACHB-2040]